MNLEKFKILITGGAGFIGSHLTDALIEKGAEVVIVDNFVTGRKENLNSKAKFYNLNIADKNLKDIFEKENPEIIYHFAFNVLVPKSTENPLLDMDSITGSVNLLKNARDFKIKKVIFSSSGFIYGNTNNLPAKETEPFQPVSSYSIAKYTIENYLKFFKKNFGLNYAIFRNAAVYGPRQITGAMADYIRNISSGGQSSIWGDGTKTRDYIFISDIIKANLKVLDLPGDFADPVFNLGTSKETALNELYSKIAEILGKKANPIYLPDRQGEQMRYSLDFSKAKEILGWEPEVSLEEGLKKILCK